MKNKTVKLTTVLLVVPYIILAMSLLVAITSWNLRGDMNTRIDNEVAKKFEQSKTNQ